MLKPKPLRRGDTIGLVGVSGAMHEPETRFEKMLEVIENLGYKVIVADSCREEYGYLSGSDASRARGLNSMFRDDRVDAVVCMRGGYGVARILDQVDFDAIRANPKILLGYSDITALHTAIHEKAGLVTLHGPMPDRAWMEFDDFSRESMLRALTSTEPLGRLENPVDEKDYTVQVWDAEIPVNASARYIKVHAANIGTIPSWHPGAGAPGFIFVDEVWANAAPRL